MKTLLLCMVLGSLALMTLGQSDTDINYYLFTRQNAQNWQKKLLRIGNSGSVSSSRFSAKKSTKILVHGWLGGFGGWSLRLKNALLSKEDVNVIIVDWGKLAKGDYITASRNTRFVGKSIGRLVEFLEKTSGTSRKNMHLIGHSLGGQTVGFAGQSLNPRPARVTGLDTAETNFNHLDRNDYLDPTDGDFVEEIYGTVSNNRYLKGHANFFPNGGNDDHMVIPEYFIASVYGGKCSYPAYICKAVNDCKYSDGNHMGYFSFKPRDTYQKSYYLYASKDKPC